MNYEQQLQEWMAKHPDATEKEAQAWKDGYKQCVTNWCTHER